jgi:ribosomal protein S18 acetylase RimI-like enzyme
LDGESLLRSPAVVREVDDPAVRAAVAAAILHALPRWFGLPDATAAYIRDVEGLRTFVAGPADEPLGFLALRVHTPAAAEIHVMGVRPDRHRHGIGTALVAAALDALRVDAVEFLQVKTLGPSHPSEAYAATRRFYLQLGFRPLEELHGLWAEGNPCLIMIRPVAEPLAAPKR